jgi:hypothetical protein
MAGKTSDDSYQPGLIPQSSFLALKAEDQKVLSEKVINLYEKLDDIVETDFYTTAYIAGKK